MSQSAFCKGLVDNAEILLVKCPEVKRYDLYILLPPHTQPKKYSSNASISPSNSARVDFSSGDRTAVRLRLVFNDVIPRKCRGRVGAS